MAKYRGQQPPYLSPKGATYGAFQIPNGSNVSLNIIATDGSDEPGAGDWEHVSVHAVDKIFGKRRVPNWFEMCAVKDLFWDDDEAVVQFHPSKKDYVNTHECVLHLWRCKNQTFPLPLKICV